jgi:hypothetical protein
MTFRTLLFLLLTLSWLGVAAAQQQPATLYIYQRSTFSRAVAFDVWINGQQVAVAFPARSYFILQAPPGVLNLRTIGRPAYIAETKTFQLNVNAGQTYYLEAILDYDFMSSALYLVQRDATEFRRRQKSLQLNENAKTKLE